jgi:hypothetical protein
MDADTENRKIRKSENHDIQYIKIYKNLKMVRGANYIVADHNPYQKE